MEVVLRNLRLWVESVMKGDPSGHDWWHIVRVVNNAKHIASFYPDCDKETIEIAATVHDMNDHKLFKGTEEEGKTYLIENLIKNGLSKEKAEDIERIVAQISFKGGCNPDKPLSLEAKIVQDADRLDAIGAIGIGRTFSFGGSKQRIMYDPNIKPQNYQNAEAYRKSTSPTINHFYEKLLLLKDRMNTDIGKKMAEDRHKFMEQYLEQFFQEWDGKK